MCACRCFVKSLYILSIYILNNSHKLSYTGPSCNIYLKEGHIFLLTGYSLQTEILDSTQVELVSRSRKKWKVLKTVCSLSFWLTMITCTHRTYERDVAIIGNYDVTFLLSLPLCFEFRCDHWGVDLNCATALKLASDLWIISKLDSVRLQINDWAHGVIG